MLVPGAAAEISFEAFSNLPFIRRRIVLKKCTRSHNHPRRAVAALETVSLPETFLYWMELAIFSEALNGGQIGSVGLDGENGARFHRIAIHPDSAGATQARFAAHVRARQSEHVAQVMDQQQPGFDLVLVCRSVDFQGDQFFHRIPAFLSRAAKRNLKIK